MDAVTIPKKRGVKPSLRFTGFEGDWKEERLGSIGDFKNGLNKQKEDFGFGSPFVNLMDVFGKNTVRNQEYSLVNASAKDLKTYDLRQGDVLFIRSSVKREGVGEAVLVLEDLTDTVYSGFLIRYRERKEILDVLYKKYCFTTRRFRTDLLASATTSANTNINQDSLSDLCIWIPTLPEQQKIAGFLSAVDARIQQLTRKKALLEQYKKGVMQQLFTQEIRFTRADGSDMHRTAFAEWEEKRLGEVCETFKSGEGITAEKITATGTYPVYGGNGLRGYTDTHTHEGFFVLIGRQGALCGNINRAYGKTFITEHAIAVAANASSDTEWLAQRLDYTKLNRLSESSAQPGLSAQKLTRLKMLFPSLEEQQKIAGFLGALDARVQAVGEQLAGCQRWKKGLLQQMFV